MNKSDMQLASHFDFKFYNVLAYNWFIFSSPPSPTPSRYLDSISNFNCLLSLVDQKFNLIQPKFQFLKQVMKGNDNWIKQFVLIVPMQHWNIDRVG